MHSARTTVTRRNDRRRALPAILTVLLGCQGFLASAGELTPQEQRGRQIYMSGTSPSGAEITAHMGKAGFPLPASVMPCSSCHGEDGKGRPEGGVIPVDVTWTYLTRSYGHQHSYGREHPAYTEATLARAITTGLDPAGNTMEIAMPLYRMARGDLEALIAYIKKLETDYDRGITRDSIRLATLLPLSGPQTALGQAIRGVLQAYVDNLNAGGGVHGRNIELEIIPFGNSARETLDALRQAVDETEIFALLAPYVIGIENDIARFAEDEGLPVIGPYTLQPPPTASLDRHTFYLFSGFEDQMRVLVDVAAERFGDAAPIIAIAGPDVEEVRALADAVSEQSETRDWSEPAGFYYARGALDAQQLSGQLIESGTEVLFFFGAPAELDDVLASLAGADNVPLICLPASNVTPALFDAPAAFDGRIMIAYPRSPTDVDANGQRAYADLRARHELPVEHPSAQLAVLAAAATLDEALKRAGKNLSRETLIASLESLYEYETGLAPPITYTLNRRIGALGAHVVRLDLASRTFAPVGSWQTLR